MRVQPNLRYVPTYHELEGSREMETQVTIKVFENLYLTVSVLQVYQNDELWSVLQIRVLSILPYKFYFEVIEHSRVGSHRSRIGALVADRSSEQFLRHTTCMHAIGTHSIMTLCTHKRDQRILHGRGLWNQLVA